ncbi:hypothetical protein U14_03787 [Candidatus Moduliflexus flocculans]|uniref:Uncharacterized protein n=1 Tax=Candidatus Moduliflexus flocculans TaxID=1499966 RepID=A0A081BQ70_9BACT|nr:hypothetical protein U14_03787 [Candidatus Moduliflexus flocculans]
MRNNSWLVRIFMILLVVASLTGCSNNGSNPTIPQMSGVLPTAASAPSGHSVTVKTLSAAELSNLYTMNGTPYGADPENPDLAVGYLNADGHPVSEFYVSIPKAGDYMVEYKASGGWYALFFRSEGPVVLVIGLKDGDVLQGVEVYHSFTFLTEDAALLTTKVGDVHFLFNYGIWEDYNDDVRAAVEYYAAKATVDWWTLE